MRVRKGIFIILGVAAAIPMLGIAVINTPPGRQAISNMASAKLQREVIFEGHAYPIGIWPPAFYVSRLKVANRDGGKAEYMLDIGQMHLTLDGRVLKDGIVRLRQLALLDSVVHLEKDADGTANWSFSEQIGAKEVETSMPPLGNLYLENSTLTYADPRQKTNITVKATTEDGKLVYTGEGTQLGKHFSLNGNAAADCLRRNTMCPVELKLAVGNTTLQAEGVLASLSPPSGIDFMLKVSGADAAELFPLLGIATPMTPPYRLTGRLTYENDRWRFTDFTGRVGESDLQGDITVDQSAARPRITANLVSRQLRFVDLGPLIGLAPEKPLSDTQQALAVRQQTSPYLIPDLPLDITRISAMDAQVEFTGKRIVSEKAPLDNVYMKLALDDRLLTLKPVRFGTAEGNISANISINARTQPVQNHAEVEFNRLSLARLFRNAGRSLGNIEPPSGEIEGTMTLKGPGKSLHEMLGNADGSAAFTMREGQVSNLLVSLMSLDIARSLGFLLAGDKPLTIRCLAASFDVEDGIMNTDLFVFDTEDTLIQGEGSVNLQREEIALRLLPSPKEVSILSLRSPIEVNGTLKDPDVGIEKGPIAARGGIAAGLAVIAPPALIAAFVDPGLGEDSDCTSLLAQAQQKTKK